MKYRMIKGVRAGYEVIRPGTVLDKLPRGWDQDRLVRIGALEILPGSETPALTKGAEDLTPPPPPPTKAEATKPAAAAPKAAPKPAAKRTAAKSKGSKSNTRPQAAKSAAPKPTPKPAPRASAPASGPQLPEGIDPNLAAAEE